MHVFLEQFKHFLYMGGYACYVWPAYSCTGIIILLSIIAPIRQRRKLLKKL